jgi:hypothetical protein
VNNTDKITACLEQSEVALLQEKISSLQGRQLDLEQKVRNTEKIAFGYLSAVQKLSEEVLKLKVWRDHKSRYQPYSTTERIKQS